MVNGRSAADRAESDAVDFLVLLEGVSGKLDADVAQHAGVVVVVRAAVLGARASLNLLAEYALVVAGLAADDQAAPVAGLALALCLLRSEDDRLSGSTFCI